MTIRPAAAGDLLRRTQAENRVRAKLLILLET